MNKENQHIEFKSSFNDEVIETLSVFANTNGGKILVGVKNDGTPVKGFTIGSESFQEWINQIKNKTQPSIIPDVNIIDYKGVEVAEFYIPEFPVKPVACRGRYFKRMKNSNHQLSPIEISDLSLQSLQISWDSYPAVNATWNDIDIEKVKKFIDKVNSTGRFYLSGIPEDDLIKLKLLNNGKITNAALLLFAREDIIYNVHLGRFKTPEMIIDDKMLRLPLFEAVDETMKYLISQLKVAFEINAYPTQRTEIFEYPLQALKETVLNTLIHRDYLSPIDVQIKIFDNKITFFNPGGLVGNLTVEDLKRDNYQAYARNRLLAEAFYLTGDIEKYGTGFTRIRKEIASYPTMKIDFEEIPNGFLVTYSYTQQKASSIDSKTGVKTGVKIDKIDNQIIRLIAINKAITVLEIAKEIKRGESTTNERLAKLKKQNIIQRVGASKGGYWEIIENIGK